MTTYIVTYEVVVDAETREDAIQEANLLIADPAFQANVEVLEVEP